MQTEFSVSLDWIQIGEDRAAQIKFQSDDCELNLVLACDELPKLQEVVGAKWSTRSSVQIGTCLGRSVFWSCEDGLLSVLVGEDVEAWEVGMTLPDSALVELGAETARLLNAK